MSSQPRYATRLLATEESGFLESSKRTPTRSTTWTQSVKFLERGVRSSPNVALNSTKYFDRWYHLLTNSSFKGYYRYIARKYEPRFAK
jgi:hypothetical protein